ncbi:tRNA 2-thiouridine(34) synthase MnmA [Miniphocaeibacter massiliensis]|uniref:tRNA 2-thiouridine(34) synthase MnmA n=1 Tax=Miniphocaeibacter massiliensis TaxID=2041841 RepID=UPI000C081855|nr:tRNA 2-thiouridine(34) synthase MnmA [Miniphocaeibacter massiliensis]
MNNKVVLGMSGGVDSSVAAYLLKEKGYDVIGVTMSLVPKGVLYNEDRGCCSITAVNEAKMVAEDMGIPHYTMNFREEFDKKIIDSFVKEYSLGYTPNPCIACNKYIKFESFRKKIHELGADYISTGHYAAIEYSEERQRYLLKKAKDAKKDQTYFLYNLSQEALSETILPLGIYTKDEVRKIGKETGIITYNKQDSEEICFVQNNDHGKFIQERNPELIGEGNFIDEKGNILGKHKGIVYYTLGQRKGLGIALGKRVFVSKINGKTKNITLSDEDTLYKREIEIKDFNLIAVDEIKEYKEVTVKIRHGVNEHLGEIIQKGSRLFVEFEKTVRAPSKGQSAVIYDGDIVVGGGIIENAR